jgi:hypothetical protein
MNVASLYLCKELYGLSGWNSEAYDDGEHIITQEDVDTGDYDDGQCVVVYDAGYLLRKLPAYIDTCDSDGYDSLLQLRPNFDGDEWTAGYTSQDRFLYIATGSGPEGALAQLAIELLKAGILSREGTS